MLLLVCFSSAIQYFGLVSTRFARLRQRPKLLWKTLNHLEKESNFIIKKTKQTNKYYLFSCSMFLKKVCQWCLLCNHLLASISGSHNCITGVWKNWFERTDTQPGNRAGLCSPSVCQVTSDLPSPQPAHTNCSGWAVVGLQSMWGALGNWQAHTLLLWQMWGVPPCPKEVS